MNGKSVVGGYGDLVRVVDHDWELRKVEHLREVSGDERGTMSAIGELCEWIVTEAPGSLRTRALGEVGVVKALLDSMKRHPRCATIQFRGFRTLWNLAVQEPVKRWIVEDGGIEIILERLASPEVPNDVMAYALGALCCIADVPRNKVVVAERGAVDAIVSVMKARRDAPSIQEWGARTLCNIAR